MLQHMFLHTGVAIGVNAESEQWGLIARKHLEFMYHVDYDFRLFDKSHNNVISKFVAQIFLALCAHIFPPNALLFGKPWYAVLAGAFNVSLNLPYHSNSVIYLVLSGLASGETWTAWFNSVAQLIMLKSAQLEYLAETGVFPVIYKSIYGDDGVFSTNEAGFNFSFLKKFFAKRNMIITPGSKVLVETDHTPWSEIDFLKRKFVQRDGVCYAPLTHKSIIKQFEWWRPSHVETEQQLMTMMINSVGGFLAAHPPGEEDEWYVRLVETFPKLYETGGLHTPFAPMAQLRALALEKLKLPLVYYRMGGEPCSSEEYYHLY
eukprot:GHVR01122326.1.p1 GENE.GHVR01122326.1~~GHVR01122326.1.p1  ORF type:complete len:318 (+),score=-0.48 GHVR01122326.1:1-954(+)